MAEVKDITKMCRDGKVQEAYELAVYAYYMLANNKGKYLLMRLEGEIRILFHLRMTGSLVYVEAGQEYENAHLRAVFYLDDGSRLCFADIRTFGVIYGLKPGELELVKGLREMGPEPLSPEFTVKFTLQPYLRAGTLRQSAPR